MHGIAVDILQSLIDVSGKSTSDKAFHCKVSILVKKNALCK